MSQIFNPLLLHSHAQIKHYLQGEEAIEEILAQEHPTPLAYGKWKIVQMIIVTPFDIIVALFLRLIADHSSQARAAHYRIAADYQLYTLWKLLLYFDHGTHYLVPSINQHQKGTKDFYLTPPLPIREINDPEVEATTFRDEGIPELRFFHKEGLCRGMDDWFTYLYLATTGHFANEEEHLIAVANHFRKGAPREAALLHTFKYTETYLDLQKFPQRTLDTADLQGDSSAILRNILIALPLGLCTIEGCDHRINYIKADEQHSYIFDPAGGLIRMPTLDRAIRYLQRVLVQVNQPDPYLTFTHCLRTADNAEVI